MLGYIVIFVVLTVIALIVLTAPLHKVLRGLYNENTGLRLSRYASVGGLDEYLQLANTDDTWPVIDNLEMRQFRRPYSFVSRNASSSALSGMRTTLVVYIPGGGMFLPQIDEPAFFRALRYFAAQDEDEHRTVLMWTRYGLAPEKIEPAACYDIASNIEEMARESGATDLVIVGFSAGAYLAWKLCVMMSHENVHAFGAIDVRASYPKLYALTASARWVLMGGFYRLSYNEFNNERDVSRFFRRWTRLHVGGSESSWQIQDPLFRFVRDGVRLRGAVFQLYDRHYDSFAYQARLLYRVLRERDYEAELVLDDDDKVVDDKTITFDRVVQNHLFVHRTRDNRFAQLVLRQVLQLISDVGRVPA